MARTPPPSRRAGTPRKNSTGGPSKPRKTRAPSKQPSPGPSNVPIAPTPRRTSRTLKPAMPANDPNTPAKPASRRQPRRASLPTVSESPMDVDPVDPATPSPEAAAPEPTTTRVDKGKGRTVQFANVDDVRRNQDREPLHTIHESSMAIDAVASSSKTQDEPEPVRRLDKGKGRMIDVDVEMVEQMRSHLRVSEPPGGAAPSTQARNGIPRTRIDDPGLAPYAASPSKPVMPLRMGPHPRANVAKGATFALGATQVKAEEEEDPEEEPSLEPFDFKPLLRNPPLLVPEEAPKTAFYDAEKRFDAQRVRNAIALFRVRNLEGTMTLTDWNLANISYWVEETEFTTGKLYKPVHIPRPSLDPLYTNGLSSISLLYYWVRRVATLAGKAISMTKSTPSAPDLHTRWEVMNTKASNPHFGTMCFMPYNDHAVPNPANVVIGVQTPFGLDLSDFKEFVRNGSFPYTPHIPLQGKYHTWANLHDSCKLHGTRWFILTSYVHWVFGVFSADYSTASVSPIYRYDTRSPNIVEITAYWFASARGALDTFIPPKSDVAIGNKMQEALRWKFGAAPQRWTGKLPTRKDYWEGRDSEIGTATSISTRTGTATSAYPTAQQMIEATVRVHNWSTTLATAPDVDRPKLLAVALVKDPPPFVAEWMVPMR